MAVPNRVPFRAIFLYTDEGSARQGGECVVLCSVLALNGERHGLKIGAVP